MEGCIKATVCILFMALELFQSSECKIYGQFVQINDMHLDPTYNETGISCNVPVSRQELQSKPYGHYECDAPMILLNSSIQEVNKNIYKVDFVMWAGDIVSHVRNKSWMDEDDVVYAINITSQLIRDGIHKDIPIYPMMGNHDYWPKHNLPTSGGLYGKVANIFCPLFNMEVDEGCDDFRNAGFYTRIIEDKMMLLILNTNLYNRDNEVVEENNPDPGGQFAYMREKLTAARQNQQMVHVFAHIPPGFNENFLFDNQWKRKHNEKFNQIIRDYHDVIIGIYSGHTHTDSFRIYYKDGAPVATLLTSPSVTPQRGAAAPRNPAFRIIRHQKTGKMELMDYQQLYLNLEKANNGTVEWEIEYHFGNYLGADNLTAKALHNVVNNNFKKDRSQDFEKYFKRNYVLISTANDRPVGLSYKCSKVCKMYNICAITCMDYEPYKKCIDDSRRPKPPVKKKDDVVEAKDNGAIRLSGMIGIFLGILVFSILMI